MLYLFLFKYDRLLLLSEHVVHLLFYLFHFDSHLLLHCDQVVHLLTFFAVSDHKVVVTGGTRTDWHHVVRCRYDLLLLQLLRSVELVELSLHALGSQHFHAAVLVEAQQGDLTLVHCLLLMA